MSKISSIDSTWEKQEDLVFDEAAEPVKVMHCDKIFNVKMSRIQQLGKYIGTGDVYVNFPVDLAHFFFKNGELTDCGTTPSFRYFCGINCYFAHWQNAESNMLKCISLFTTQGNKAQTNGILMEKGENLKNEVQEAIIHFWDGTNKLVNEPKEVEELRILMMCYNLKQDLVWD